MKKLTNGKIWCFAMGQFGWSILAALISNWLVTFYEPSNEMIEKGHALYIPQGRIIIGIATILGAITAFGRIFDAITDPLIASASDKHNSKNGRRIPFMKAAAIPFGALAVITFVSPVSGTSWVNAVFLFVVLTLFYLFMTMYCTPYNALIPELGSTQKTRMAISTSISFTYIAGMALVYLAPVIWDTLGNYMERMLAIRVTFGALSLIGTVCMFIPVFTIKETDYVKIEPTKSTAMSSLIKTFRNKDFRCFVASDVSYFLGITMFQTALPFFVTSLLKLDETMSSMYFVVMTALSIVFYIPINKLAPKMGKKKLILVAFVIFTVSFVYTALLGNILPIPAVIQGYILCVIAAPAMAIFGILPQAVVADIAECDAIETNENRAGMFYAARTFAFKVGQSCALLIVTALATIRKDIGLGYRLVALVAAVVCILGGLLFALYNEKRVVSKISK